MTWDMGIKFATPTELDSIPCERHLTLTMEVKISEPFRWLAFSITFDGDP